MSKREEISCKFPNIDGVMSDYMSIILKMPYNKISKILLLNNEHEWVSIYYDMLSHLKKVKIYKSKEAVVDNFTIIIGSDFYAMNQYPLSMHGFNQYCGGVEDGYSESNLISKGDILVDIYNDLTTNRELIKAIFIRLRDDIL